MSTIKGTDADTTGQIFLVNGAAPAIALMTAEIDFTAAAATYEFIGSRQPGKRFVGVVNANWVKILYTQVSGVLSVQAAGTWGNNTGSVDNYLTGSTAITSATGFSSGAGTSEATLGANVRPVTIDLTTPLAVKILTPASGTNLVLKGRIIIIGSFVPM